MQLEDKIVYIDRGFYNNLVLISGWATDYRIFNFLNLEYNYILATQFNPFSLADSIAKFLDKSKIKKVKVFGWSLGGFLATEFAFKYPEFVETLFLLSIKQKYSLQQIEGIKNYILKNKKAYLYKFYSEGFFDKKNFKFFKNHLFKEYLEELSTQQLILGLNYLKEAEIKPESLSKIENIVVLQGKADKIVSYDEAIIISKNIKNCKFFLIEEAGHFLFLEKDISNFIC